MNSVLALLSYIVHDRLGLKSQADRESPLKWTLTIVMLCSPLQRTLTVSQEIYFRAGSVRSLLKMAENLQ
ncbi:hypothetical protein DP115_12275 [Brasilonema octagenarum UFV-OR1]|uniref:Transposase n=1 Tax=Brasilonema octagenarum UFV-OR1 TaxID=417115 RepID=A0ABX1M4P2_9CYAN|nr:hypothetical protein [Brasilonema octagenarum UFV-OR1]